MKVIASRSINCSLLFCQKKEIEIKHGRPVEVTYIVLVPHDEKECVQGQIEIGPSEARKRAKDASGEEHVVEVLLGVRQELLDLPSRVSLLRTHLLLKSPV